MRNKLIILALVVVLVFAYLYFAKPQAAIPQSDAVKNISAGVIDAKTTVSDSVAKTNPFDVKVNPYDGYKNPFAK